MKILYKTDNYSIQYLHNHFYEIIFVEPSKHLIQSLVNTNLILGASVTPEYMSIRFKSSSIAKYKSSHIGLEISVLAKIMSDLSTQLSYLNTFCQKSFLGFSPKHLFVLDETTWIYLSDEFLFDITEQGKLEVLYPFNHTDFYMAPELYQIKEIPSKVPLQVAYYSLGVLIILASYPNSIEIQEPEQLFKEVYWKGTKFYYFIKRCIETEPQKRYILFL